MNDNKILDPSGVCLFGIRIGRKNRLSIRKTTGYLKICPNVFCVWDFLKNFLASLFESLLKFRSRGYCGTLLLLTKGGVL